MNRVRHDEAQIDVVYPAVWGANTGLMDVSVLQSGEALNAASPRLAAPVVISLSTVTSPNWRLRIPLAVELFQDPDGSWVAGSTELALFSSAEERWDAVRGLQDEVVAAREELEAQSDSLAPGLETLLVQLRQILEPVTAR